LILYTISFLQLENVLPMYFLQREQLREHEDTLRQLEVELEIHKKKPPERGTKNITLQFYKEKESHLLEEVSFNIF